MLVIISSSAERPFNRMYVLLLALFYSDVMDTKSL